MITSPELITKMGTIFIVKDATTGQESDVHPAESQLMGTITKIRATIIALFAQQKNWLPNALYAPKKLTENILIIIIKKFARAVIMKKLHLGAQSVTQ